MMRLLKSLLVVALLSAVFCVKGDLSVEVRSDLSSKAGKPIGLLSYEWRGSLSTVDIEITDTELYSKMLKDAGTTYYFEFKAGGVKGSPLKSAIK